MFFALEFLVEQEEDFSKGEIIGIRERRYLMAPKGVGYGKGKGKMMKKKKKKKKKKY